MTFTLAEVPTEPLARLGTTRGHLGWIPADSLSALLSGVRTRLMRFTSVRLSGSTVPATLDARLSLFRKRDGSVGVRFHPVDGQTLDRSLKGSDGEGGLRMVETASLPDTMTEDGSKGRSHGERGSEGLHPASAQEDRNPLSEDLKSGRNSLGSRRDYEMGKGESDDKEISPEEADRAAGREKTHTRGLNVSHSRVEDVDLMLDLGLLASGLGGIILLEHLADLALHTRIVKKPLPLHDRRVRDMLASVYGPVTNGRNASGPDDTSRRLREYLKEHSHALKTGKAAMQPAGDLPKQEAPHGRRERGPSLRI